jgi:hypothetical protein
MRDLNDVEGTNTFSVRAVDSAGTAPVGVRHAQRPVLLKGLPQRVDRCGRDDAFDAARQLRVERDERVCL